MRRLLKWLFYALGGLAGLILLAALVITVGAEVVLRRHYPLPPPRTVPIPTDSASLAEGKRLANIHGCFHGCHGMASEGSVLFDEPNVARVVAPDLTRALRRYSDGEIERIVRRGIRPDGSSVLVMPSEVLAHLSDLELGRILGFLKSLPPTQGFEPSRTVRILGRLGLVTGQFHTAAALAAKDSTPPPSVPPTDSLELGPYLAHTICAECHGLDLKGQPNFPSPNLMVVNGYGLEDFEKLLQTGRALGDRELGLMSRAVRARLVSLTAEERRALYRYLHGFKG